MIIEICCNDGETILQACRREQIFSENVCGGKGICGKCKVRMLSNVVPASGGDETFFTEAELEEGWRLACLAKPQGMCQIELPVEREEEMSVVTDSFLGDVIKGGKNKEIYIATTEPEVYITNKQICENECDRNETQKIRIENSNEDKKEIKNGKNTNNDKKASSDTENNSASKNAIIIDIGTTTIAMQLILCKQDDSREWKTEVLATYTAVNSQRAYGADVLSRIQASNEGKGELLQNSILETLAKGLEVLETNTPVEAILLAGNTTMVHLLMGYSCEMLGRAPFKPVATESIQIDAPSLFSSDRNKKAYLSKKAYKSIETATAYIFPGISAFVGGDIVAGLYYTGFYKEREVQLLIDLGTNGEMVIGNRMRMLATSTAAGPAFEGGGLSCGCAGIKGAICGGELLKNGTWKFATIGGGEPVGICGSGIVEILYELLQKGLMDDTGLLAEGNSDRVDLVGETVYITQQDIRQFQMAKAAIRAGVETLMQTYGAEIEDVSRIYIAGGFGYYLNLQKATAIGLFPNSFLGKMTAIGNSSLAGLREYATARDEGKLLNIKKYTGDCQLAENSYFQEKYIECMYFS